MRRILVFASLFLALPAQAVVKIDWVTVGDPGNVCEVQSDGCYGAVAYTYRIGKYEVTNAQYAEFLNAEAATDTNMLYNIFMGSGVGGITRSGTAGSFSYSAIAGREDMPVIRVSLRELASQQAADGRAGQHHDRGRSLHSHRRRNCEQYRYAQRRSHGLHHQRRRVVQGRVLRPRDGQLLRLPGGLGCADGVHSSRMDCEYSELRLRR
jgi:hypothetical protein